MILVRGAIRFPLIPGLMMGALMKIKLFMTLFIIAISASCQRNDALSHLNSNQLVDVLWNSARFAENKLSIKPSLGSTYIVCMDEVDHTAHCTDFFNAMLARIHAQKHFRTVSLDQLTNVSRYQGIRDQYVSVVMSHLPSKVK